MYRSFVDLILEIWLNTKQYHKIIISSKMESTDVKITGENNYTI